MVSINLIDWKRLLEQHGFTEAQVRQWAQRRYPMFANNLALMTYLFLQEHGIEIRPRVVGVYQPKKVVDLEVGDRAEITVLVGAKIGEVHYYGCPQCYSKVEEREGGKFYCSKCSEFVDPQEYAFKRYIVGDETGTTVCVLPPYVEGELEVGKAYKLRGRVTENNEFFVREYESYALPAPEAETVSEEKVIETSVKVESARVEETPEEVIEAGEVEIAEAIEEKIEEKPEAEEKPLEERVLEYLANRKATINELLREFGDGVLSVVTDLRQRGLIKLVKEQNKYLFTVAEGRAKETKIMEIAEERKVKRAKQVKLVEEPKKLDEFKEKLRKMLNLFGGSIGLRDLENWYVRSGFASLGPLKDVLSRLEWVEVSDDTVSLKG